MVERNFLFRPFVAPVLIVSFFLTGASALLLQGNGAGTALTTHIQIQVTIICILYALSGLVLFLHTQTPHIPVFLFKIFLIYFIVSASGSHILSIICLLFSFCFEVFFFCTTGFSFSLSATLLSVLFFSLSAHTAWSLPQNSITASETVIILLVATAASICGRIMSSAIENNRAHEREIRRLEDAVDNLTKTNTAYQTYATYIEETSKEEERHRIAREVHDIVGYSMTNLLMIVQAALYSENQDQITELLQKARTHINESLQEVRMALRKLRSTQKKPLHGSELVNHLAHNFQNVTGIRITLDFISFPHTISLEVEELLYRMLQEAMTNSFRHGRATEIYISFWTSGATLIVQIRDNGQTHHDSQIVEGIGFQGMRERLSGIGGSVTMESVKDGFTILAHVPLQKKEW
jgi:signal transduction histidine kinase